MRSVLKTTNVSQVTAYFGPISGHYSLTTVGELASPRAEVHVRHTICSDGQMGGRGTGSMPPPRS